MESTVVSINITFICLFVYLFIDFTLTTALLYVCPQRLKSLVCYLLNIYKRSCDVCQQAERRLMVAMFSGEPEVSEAMTMSCTGVAVVVVLVLVCISQQQTGAANVLLDKG